MSSHHTAASNVRWDLTSFYSGISDPQIDLDIAEFAKQAEQFSSNYKGKLAETAVWGDLRLCRAGHACGQDHGLPLSPAKSGRDQ